MKQSRMLLSIAGIANLAFFLFHLFLGWRIQQFTQLPPPLLSLLQIMNGGEALIVLFLGVVSLGYRTDMTSTRLGNLVTILGATLYFLRALAEIFLSARPNPGILLTCFFVAFVYGFALYFNADRSAAGLRPARLAQRA